MDGSEAASHDRQRVRARAGVTGAVGAGVALAAIQILQQSIGAFEPRPIVRVLIALCVGAATLSLDRWRTLAARRKERADSDARLGSLLRAWPLPRMRRCEPLALGVFPRRRGDAGGEADQDDYVARSVDARLDEALVESPFVLLFGPERAGKSRTAYEAARRALPDARVIAPRGGEALKDLLADGIPVPEGSGRTILWLDGLERYLDAIDTKSLDDLEALDGDLLAVATIRTEEWEALLRAAGQRGEGAKAVAARARAFEVPAQDGIGSALSSSGMEEIPAPSERRGRAETKPPEEPVWRDRLLVAATAAGLVAIGALAVVGITGGISEPQPLSIDQQAINVRHKLGAGRVTRSERIDLRGTDEPSYFFIFQAGPGGVRSDEIAVYDVEGDKLVEHLRFEPGGERAVFQRRHVGDVDDDGRAELVGGFARAGRLGGALVPFAIDWDDGAGRYRLISLQAERPALARIKIRDAVAAGVRPSYRRPVSFRDERPAYRRELRGFRAHDFAVTPPPERLLVGYLIEPRNQENGPRLEVAPFQFRKTEGRPHVVPCERRDLRKPLKVAVAVDRPPTAAMLEEWGKLDDEGRRCKPVLAAPPTP